MRSRNEIRKIFVKLFREFHTPVQIANILGCDPKTIRSWIDILVEQGEEKLMRINIGSKPKYSLSELFVIFSMDENLTKFNYELSEELGISTSAVQLYRSKLSFKNKKVKTIYKEANDELKKTLQRN